MRHWTWRTIVTVLIVGSAATLLEHAIWSALALPAISTLILIVEPAISRVLRKQTLSSADRALLLKTLAIIGGVLYPISLGVFPGDLYRAGFSPAAPLVLALVAAAVAPWRFRISCVALLILVAFDVHLCRSLNVFDYIVDPFVTLFAIGWWGLREARRLSLFLQAALRPPHR